MNPAVKSGPKSISDQYLSENGVKESDRAAFIAQARGFSQGNVETLRKLVEKHGLTSAENS